MATTNRQQLLVRMRDAFSENFDIDPEKVVPEANLYEDLEIDSIDAVDLLAWVRQITGTRVSPERFREVRTVDDVLTEIERIMS